MPSSTSNTEQTVTYYDSWSENYEKDTTSLQYTGPNLAVDFLCSKFRGDRKEVRVLDVACGTGLVAKAMVKQGFRNIVGVDAAELMLEQAASSGLYQDLRRAFLGKEPLPAEPGSFDVVIIVSALFSGFVPVSVVRELCLAAKPGGLICIANGHHTGTAYRESKEKLETLMQQMEEEGAWSQVDMRHIDKFMKERVTDESFIGGTCYLYKKNHITSLRSISV